MPQWKKKNQVNREDIPTEVAAFHDNLFVREVRTNSFNGERMQVNRMYLNSNKLEKWLLKKADEYGYGELLKDFSPQDSDSRLLKLLCNPNLLHCFLI